MLKYYDNDKGFHEGVFYINIPRIWNTTSGINIDFFFTLSIAD